MKTSNKSWIVFVISFAICLFILYSISDDGKKMPEAESLLDDTTVVGSSSAEGHIIPSTDKDTAKTRTGDVSTPRITNEEKVESQQKKSTKENRRSYPTRNMASSAKEGILSPQSGSSSSGNDVVENSMTQQMAVRQRVSDKIVQTNWDRAQHELDRGAAAAKRIRTLLGESR